MEYLRAKQAAQYMGIATSTLWLFTKQNKLKSIKLSERVTIWAKTELDTFIASRAGAQYDN